MGIRINNTWRLPLQLIDSWLPAPSHRASTRKGPPQLVQRFTRAGWLGRHQPAASTGSVDVGPMANTAPSLRVCRVRVVPPASGGFCHDARLVISGRMADVCAELDRLAALEHQTVGTARI